MDVTIAVSTSSKDPDHNQQHMDDLLHSNTHPLSIEKKQIFKYLQNELLMNLTVTAVGEPLSWITAAIVSLII